MPCNGDNTHFQIDNPAWLTSGAESLEGQMALLQSALESSKQAVEEFHRRAAANLEATERRYRDLFDNVPAGIYWMSPEGYLTMANPAMIRMLGYDDFDELSKARHSTPWRRVSAAQPSKLIGFERTWRGKTGEHITVRESCRAVRGSDGKIAFYEGVVEDITGQRKSQVLERDCRSFLELVARNEPMERVGHQLVCLVERQLAGATAYLLLARNGYLIPITGTAAMTTRYDFRCKIAEDACFLGRAAFRKQVAVIEDLEVEPEWERSDLPFASASFGSCWAMPISCREEGELAAMLCVCRTVPHAPDFTELEIVETACRLAGVAIEHRNLQHDLEKQAMQDRLTGLPNRRFFEEHLAAAIDRAPAEGKLGLLWIDLDRFKEINDTFGHRAGDELIGLVADRLQPEVAGLLARTGGDEFAVLMDPCEDAATALAHAEELLECLRRPFVVRGCELFVTASIGVAVFPEHGKSASELAQNADAAMYTVKGRMRNGAALYENSLGDAIRARAELGNALRKALEHCELELYFQPQIKVDGTLRGLEALLRWRHPNFGLLAPGHFLDIAEETGLIVPIGAWVIEEACRRCAEWNRNRQENPLIVAVNVSALQFYFSDLFEVVQRALSTTGLSPDRLELELTESVLMRDAQHCARELDKLRAVGVTIAIDHFQRDQARDYNRDRG